MNENIMNQMSESGENPARLRICTKLSQNNLYRICVDRNYFTCGDCQQYSDFLDRADGSEVSTTDLYLLAIDIKKYSDTDDTVEDIMQYLYMDACLKFLSY